MAAGKWVVAAALLGAAGAATVYGLGQWKAAGIEARQLSLLEGAASRPVLGVGGQTVADVDVVDRAQLKGRLDPRRHALVPHQLPDGRRGYDVWTALEFRSGISMGEFSVINRGWISEAAASNSELLVPPSGEIEIEGLWLPVPASSEDEISLEVCSSDAWPKLIGKPQPSYTDMKCLFNAQQIAQGIVLMTSRLAGGFENDWAGFQRSLEAGHRRNAYLAFAAAVLALIAMAAALLAGMRMVTPPPRAEREPEAPAMPMSRPAPATKGKLVR